jgi:hypothetical protein
MIFLTQTQPLERSKRLLSQVIMESKLTKKSLRKLKMKRNKFWQTKPTWMQTTRSKAYLRRSTRNWRIFLESTAS